jgi:WD40 repeat protein
MLATSIKHTTVGCMAVALIALGACGNQGAPRTGNVRKQVSGVTISTTSAVPLSASFVGLTPPRSPQSAAGRLALFSTANGRRLRFLTAQRPGGGAFNPVVSADGRTVAFERGGGPCDETIDTVPANGGRERVLIPVKSSGSKRLVPSSPTYSSDGLYLAYLTTGCSVSSNDVIHVRNLRTGHELTGRGYLPERAVFVNSDRQIVFPYGGALVVVRLPSFARHTVKPPRGCQYVLLAGTETKLAATVECGRRHVVSIVAISTRTFTVTKTVLRLSHCSTCLDLSFAATDPSALLVATDNPCVPVRGAIYVIRGQTARLVVSRSAQRLPYEIVW